MRGVNQRGERCLGEAEAPSGSDKYGNRRQGVDAVASNAKPRLGTAARRAANIPFWYGRRGAFPPPTHKNLC